MYDRFRNTLTWILLLSLCACVAGCNRGVKHQAAAVARFEQGSPDAAISALDLAAESRGAEQEIIAADRAIACLVSGNPSGCETPLRLTRQKMDFLRQKDIRERTTAVITDDKAVAWSGREFEQRMIDNLLTLSSLLGNRQDAFAYSSQAMEHVHEDQTALASTARESDSPITTVGHSRESARQPQPTARHAANALAAYLEAAIRSENSLDLQLAERAIQQVRYWNSPSTQASRENVDTANTSFGTLSPQGHGVVHVITFVGRITDWTSEAAVPTTSALLIADQILSAVGDHTVPPTIAPVKIAKPLAQFSRQPGMTHARARTSSPPQTAASTTLVDLNHAAYDSWQANRDKQIARAVARRVIKKAAVYAAKDQLAIDGGSGADLLLNLGGVAWEAMEKADTRHLHLLPERIEVLRMVVPAGRHELEIWSAPSIVNPSNERLTIPVIVDDGRNTFVLCFRPHGSLAGSVLTSDGSLPISL